MPGSDKSDLQTRVAQIALRAADAHGFVLAGGKALQVHGLSSRPTEDVDLFTNSFDIEIFSREYGMSGRLGTILPSTS